MKCLSVLFFAFGFTFFLNSASSSELLGREQGTRMTRIPIRGDKTEYKGNVGIRTTYETAQGKAIIFGYTYFVTGDRYEVTMSGGSVSGDPGFTLIEDGCNGTHLGNGDECIVRIKFDAPSVGSKSVTYSYDYVKLDWEAEDPPGVSTGRTIEEPTIVNVIARKPDEPVSCPMIRESSVIRVDGLSFGERIPIVGTNFDIVYSSEFAPQYLVDYENVNRKRSFNTEGWTFSIQHFYNIEEKRLFKGDGTSYVRDSIKQTNGQHWVFDGDEVYVFDTDGKHLRTRTILTGAIKWEFAYGVNGRLITMTDAFGNVTQFHRNANDRLNKITSPFGSETLINRNNDSMITKVINPRNEAHEMEYDVGTDLLKKFITPFGRTTLIEYDARGRLVSTRKGSGGYDFVRSSTSLGSQIEETTRGGQKTTYQTSQHYSGSHSRTEVSPSGFTKVFSRAANGAYLSEDPLNKIALTKANDIRFGSVAPTTSGVTNQVGNKTKKVSYSQEITGATGYFVFDSLKEVTEINGLIWKSTFNRAANSIVNLSPEGVTSTTKVDAHERIIEFKLHQDTPFSVEYDSFGRTKKVYQGSHNQFEYFYDVNGNLERVVNARNETTSFTYDLAGRLRSSTKDGRTTNYSYDRDGLLVGVTPPGRTLHEFRYDSVGDVRQYTPPVAPYMDRRSTLYERNKDRQLIRLYRPQEPLVDFIYDSKGRISKASSGGQNQTYQYKPQTELVDSLTSFGGVKSLFQYFGSTTSSERQVLLENPNFESEISYQFDNNFRPHLRKISADFLSMPSNTTTSYNKDGSPIKIGDMDLTYESGTGRLYSTALDQISDRYEYDSYGQLYSYKAFVGASTTPIFLYTLDRDIAGRVVGKTETVLGMTTRYQYEFDAQGRLKNVLKNGALDSSYQYDDNGNRTSALINGQNRVAAYDSQDRLYSYGINTYQYNANGDLISAEKGLLRKTSFSYDPLGRLKSVVLPSSKSIEYILDGSGNRFARKVNGAIASRSIFENFARVAYYFDETERQSKEFVFGTSVSSPDYMIYRGSKYRFIKDHLGSPRLVVRSSDGVVAQQMDYTVWGETLMDTNRGFQPYGFAGGILDQDTQLLKFGARNYDPEVGRWTSKDPILFMGGDANLYGYTWNDPVNFVDPMGLWGFQIGVGAGGMLGLGGAGFSGGLAVTYSQSHGLQIGGYLSSQWNGGIGASAGRGIQASVSPNACSLQDLGGTSPVVGVDTPLFGASVSGSSSNPQFGISVGPSLGAAVYGGAQGTQVFPFYMSSPQGAH
ncbi:putative deoxyribonuclease RhsB [compost metagenome]